MNTKIYIKLTFVLVATYFLLNTFLKMSIDIGNADELALGKATTSVYANLNDIKIHCEGYSDSNECINSCITTLPNSSFLHNETLFGFIPLNIVQPVLISLGPI